MFKPREISPEMAAQGYNNEGRGRLLGYIAEPDKHEKTCPYRKDKKSSCACRIGLWQDLSLAKPRPSIYPEPDNSLAQQMANRFLGWRLPEEFHPDGGITFKRTFNDHLPTPSKHEPTGTNLFDATQARQMVDYMLAGITLDWNVIEAARDIAETKYDIAYPSRASAQRVRDVMKGLLKLIDGIVPK